MPDASSWLAASTEAQDWVALDGGRAVNVGLIIADKPASIVVYRKGVAQTAQTVRVDVYGSSVAERLSMGANALTNTQRVLVLGFRNHPTTADTDLQANDEFAYDGQSYRVVKLEPGMTDRLEAVAEATE